jgi:hypothetical protein
VPDERTQALERSFEHGRRGADHRERLSLIGGPPAYLSESAAA